ncbi:ATP-grasp domain-containing protein [Phenylobacterium sp.]|uniref:ATP-grasp domain-containing protein n=1 Tax=Phenylobacterium sp. TaxID=1871053 RepID=UPI0035B23826
MNVLVLSAAAKVLLVRAFREAAEPRGGTVFAADLTPDNAALFEADGAVLLPRSDDAGFGAALIEACRRHRIGLVVPTRDGELEVLAGLRPWLAAEGVTPLVASPEALSACRDKRRFVEACRAHGLETPRTYPAGERPERFPVFVRPVQGAGGAGARRIDHPADLPRDPDLLVQDLDTAPEYTVDALMDLEGRPLQAVARRRLQVRAGEAVKSQVVDAPELTYPALRLCEAFGLVGHNVVQAFYEPGRPPRFIEANPRFGGASNLSIRAGLASPERLLQMLAGESDAAAAPRAIAHGLMMLRYAEDRLVTPAELAAVAP